MYVKFAILRLINDSRSAQVAAERLEMKIKNHISTKRVLGENIVQVVKLVITVLIVMAVQIGVRLWISVSKEFLLSIVFAPLVFGQYLYFYASFFIINRACFSAESELKC